MDTALERIALVVVTGGVFEGICGLVDDTFVLIIAFKKLFNAHLTELVSFNQNHFRNGGCLLTVLIRLHVLAQL